MKLYNSSTEPKFYWPCFNTKRNNGPNFSHADPKKAPKFSKNKWIISSLLRVYIDVVLVRSQASICTFITFECAFYYLIALIHHNIHIWVVHFTFWHILLWFQACKQVHVIFHGSKFGQKFYKKKKNCSKYSGWHHLRPIFYVLSEFHVHFSSWIYTLTFCWVKLE